MSENDNKTTEYLASDELAKASKSLSDIGARLDELEKNHQQLMVKFAELYNKMPTKISKEDIDAAITDHPVIADFRTFAEKWRNR